MEKIGARVSGNIRKILTEKNMKQYELAEKLGRTQENVSYFLKGLEKKSSANLKTLIEYAKVLEVDISIFFV